MYIFTLDLYLLDMGALLLLALLALLLPAASVRFPDNGDGSYSNPVMMSEALRAPFRDDVLVVAGPY